MPIRFYVPLPGPFAWVPGKRRPKQNTGPSLTDSIAASNERNLHSAALSVAESYKHPQADHYADDVVALHKSQRTMWGLIGVVASIIFWSMIIGPGFILTALIPVIGIPFLVMAAAPAVVLVLIMTRRARIMQLVAIEHGMIAAE